MLLTGGDDANRARIWDAATGGPIAGLERSRGYWHGDRLGPRIADFGPVATFNSDGSRVLLVSDSGETAVWDTASGHLVATLRILGMAIVEASLVEASLNDNGTRAALAGVVDTGRADRTDLVSWDIAIGGHYQPVAFDVAAMMSDDTGMHVLYEERGQFHVWSAGVDGPRPSIRISDAITLRTSLAFRGDQPLVALLREPGKTSATVDLWDLAKRDSHTTIASGGATDATLVPGGRYLVTSVTNTDGVERKTVWDTVSGNEVSSFDANRAPLYAIGRPAEFYSAYGALHGAIDLPDHVRAWDLATGQPVRSWLGRDHWLDFATESPDGKLLATWSRNEGGEIRGSGSGTPSARMSGLAGEVRSASFSGDGKRLVAADDRGNVMVWEAAAGRVLLALSTPPGPEWAPAVDKKRLPSRPPFRLPAGDRAPVVALSPDGTRLVTASRAPGGGAAVTDTAPMPRVGVGKATVSRGAGCRPDFAVMRSGNQPAPGTGARARETHHGIPMR